VGEKDHDAALPQPADDRHDAGRVRADGHRRHAPAARLQQPVEQVQVAGQGGAGCPADGHERALEVQARDIDSAERWQRLGEFAERREGFRPRVRHEGGQHRGDAEPAELSGRGAHSLGAHLVERMHHAVRVQVDESGRKQAAAALDHGRAGRVRRGHHSGRRDLLVPHQHVAREDPPARLHDADVADQQ
jgi:hypothetical protein